MRKNFNAVVLAVAAALLLTLFPASAATIAYNMDLTVGTASAVGSITTDGTIGTLGASDIVSYDLTLTNGAYTTVFNNSGTVAVNGTSLTATDNGLFFNFSNNTISDLTLDPLLAFAVNGPPGSISLNLSSIGDPNSPIFVTESGNVEIASSSVSATPLPSTWGMMLLGLGVLGFMGYRRKRNDNAHAAA
jgi:PEP-CTERM motif